MTYMAFDDIKLDLSSTVRRNQRVQRVQFGDGYSQVLTDGLNIEQEIWDCKTIPLTNDEAFSIESFLLSKKGQAITWTPPFNTKTFSRPFESNQLLLGYTNLSALTLTGYTRPTNYTANLVTGVLTSVTIANGTVVDIELTLSARTFLLGSGWTLTPVSPEYSTLQFEMRRVYI